MQAFNVTLTPPFTEVRAGSENDVRAGRAKDNAVLITSLIVCRTGKLNDVSNGAVGLKTVTYVRAGKLRVVRIAIFGLNDVFPTPPIDFSLGIENVVNKGITGLKVESKYSTLGIERVVNTENRLRLFVPVEEKVLNPAPLNWTTFGHDKVVKLTKLPTSVNCVASGTDILVNNESVLAVAIITESIPVKVIVCKSGHTGKSNTNLSLGEDIPVEFI